MGEGFTERRQAENEQVFRRTNEQAANGLAEIKHIAEAEGHTDLIKDEDIPLFFYCECADENCRERIQLKPSEYTQLHQNMGQFIVLPGHQVGNIERVVFDRKDLLIVEKYQTPPHDSTLHKTDITNV